MTSLPELVDGSFVHASSINAIFPQQMTATYSVNGSRTKKGDRNTFVFLLVGAMKQEQIGKLQQKDYHAMLRRIGLIPDHDLDALKEAVANIEADRGLSAGASSKDEPVGS